MASNDMRDATLPPEWGKCAQKQGDRSQMNPVDQSLLGAVACGTGLGQMVQDPNRTIRNELESRISKLQDQRVRIGREIEELAEIKNKFEDAGLVDMKIAMLNSLLRGY